MLIDYLTTNNGVEFVLTGKTNQDCLENFFSRLRGKGGFNYTPSSNEIGTHFANIIVTKLLFNSEYSNCIADNGDMVELEWNNFQELYKESLVHESDPQDNSIADEFLIIQEPNSECNVLKQNAVSYYAGYCAFKKINCDECRIKLIKDDEIPSTADTFIFEKNLKKTSNFGSLKAPTTEYAKVAYTCLAIFEETFKKDCHLPNICAKATEKCIAVIERDFPGFMPLKDDGPCYNHIYTLINFFILVLIRKNSKWSVFNGQFKNSKAKNKLLVTQASKRLRILNN